MRHLAAFRLMPAVVAALSLLACGDDGGNGGGVIGTPTGVAMPTDGELELELTAANTQFDKERLEAPAGTEVFLTLENKDAVDHNFSLYASKESAEEGIFEGDIFAGPSFLTYQFTAPPQPGTYYFQCDVHPDVMEGEFIVQ